MARAWGTEAVKGTAEPPKFQSMYQCTTEYQNANKDLSGRIQDCLLLYFIGATLNCAN